MKTFTIADSNVLHGRREHAEYQRTDVPFYDGNPLIEALPPLMSEEVARDMLGFYPPYNESERTKPAHIRLHLIQTALQFFEPMPIHFRLEIAIARMIRSGYRARNPILRSFWTDTHARSDSVKVRPRIITKSRPRSTASGFNVVGISGVGKTTGIEELLKLYPQVIIHEKYNEAPLHEMQVVWLKLSCPSDGSIKGLCQNFFLAVDSILGTRYYETHGGGRTAVDMLPRMALVVSIHHLGVLVIDEIQHLVSAHSGGDEIMLNFFVNLVNDVGLPVILVGTPKAAGILTKQFRMARRASGQGEFAWNRMQQDETWELFAEGLWRYQYTQSASPFETSRALVNTLYDQCQGITDFATKLYMLAQARVISNKSETLTPEIICSVAIDSLVSVQPFLQALRRGFKGDRSSKLNYDDVRPIDFDACFERQQDAPAATPSKGIPPSAATTASSVPVPLTPLTTPQSGPASLKPVPPLAGAKPKCKLKSMSKSVAPEGMVSAVLSAREQNVAPHEALRAAGFLRPVAEYLEPNHNA